MLGQQTISGLGFDSFKYMQWSKLAHYGYLISPRVTFKLVEPKTLFQTKTQELILWATHFLTRIHYFHFLQVLGVDTSIKQLHQLIKHPSGCWLDLEYMFCLRGMYGSFQVSNFLLLTHGMDMVVGKLTLFGIELCTHRTSELNQPM